MRYFFAISVLLKWVWIFLNWANWHYISNCTELLELIWMWPWTLALLSKLTTWYQLLELVWMWPSWTLTLLNNLTSWYLELQWTVDMGLNATFLNFNLTEQSDKLILRITVNCWHGFECDLLELHLYWTNERGLPSWFVFVVSVSSISVSVPFSVSVTRPLSISIPGSLCIPVSSIWIPYQNENKITV